MLHRKNEDKSRQGRSNKHYEKNTLQFRSVACACARSRLQHRPAVTALRMPAASRERGKHNPSGKTGRERCGDMSGEDFDHAYMLDMVRDHTKDVAAFRTEAKTAKDPAIKNFASQTLPTLEEHLKQAKSIELPPRRPLRASRKPRPGYSQCG